tara:strand:+ start:1548 stop:1832 length:285 start_codon:yes stop_codon:yes gene_type:complete
MEENQYLLLATEVKASLEILSVKIDDLKEKQEEVATIINKVEKSLYAPDDGIYARIRDLEQWKKTHSKIMWMVVTATVTMVAYFIKSGIESILA